MAESQNQLLGPLLKNVSRSFYLTLRVLPAKIRPQIGLAYLLARTTDTIADTSLIALERRFNALERLRARIQGTTDAPLDFTELAQHQGSSGERILLEKCESSLALLRTLSPGDIKLVREVLGTITSGQELDLQRFAGARGIGGLYLSGGGVRWGILDEDVPGASLCRQGSGRILPAQPWCLLWPRTATC